MQLLDQQTGAGPATMTSKSKLTPGEKEVFVNLTSYGLKAGLVLRAIKTCGEREIECQDWCTNHLNDPDFDTAEAPEVHLDSDQKIDVIADASKNLGAEKPVKSMAGSDEILDVDQDHPLFSKLLSLGYKHQESIEAIRMCGYNDNAAVKYLTSANTR